MQLSRVLAHDLAKLNGELLAALPPVPVAGLEGPVARFALSGDGSALTLLLPDDLTAAELALVDQTLAAHDPTPLPPTLGSLDAVLAALDGATTLVGVKTALRTYFLSLRD